MILILWHLELFEKRQSGILAPPWKFMFFISVASVLYPVYQTIPAVCCWPAGRQVCRVRRQTGRVHKVSKILYFKAKHNKKAKRKKEILQSWETEELFGWTVVDWLVIWPRHIVQWCQIGLMLLFKESEKKNPSYLNIAIKDLFFFLLSYCSVE